LLNKVFEAGSGTSVPVEPDRMRLESAGTIDHRVPITMDDNGQKIRSSQVYDLAVGRCWI